MKNYRGYALLSISSAVIALAISLMLKASVGVGAFDAFTQSVSLMAGIRIGTVAMTVNLLCVLGQLILLKRDFGFNRLLQIPMSVLVGMLVNFFYYDLLGTAQIENYVTALITFFISLVTVAFSVSMIMTLNLITPPIESFCMELTKSVPLKFSTIRQLVDILCIVVSVVITFTFGFTLPVREGTVIGMLIFAPLLGFFINKIQPVLLKKGIVQEAGI
ncbi:YczE/YyaS/YitT family protein [Alkalibacterium olivapovliticus]|uniref:Putative membrane protein YczE n=1 Tax=Alkalibacterium olivapovliticus TaxID=99907 RepID=A0A2T0W8A1_9LACT|nr:hypothetical protein [Alkalibacterium olivapovliticus]PRY82941.1 putative membrane protein YczE [Alkalibacterium olivapovliticus]